ncbi:pantoate--beta-alanine ligase [Dehalogenimonas alkenigignens]|uniref:Pantothenate synthetase n=1 Tax=Dehalogenimonas alkenigignens TaxID=1217799 RepID=A0A0W0GJI2_9CHLR|nr:pantoate--beta-alanine ligase [Dehalogenimonas alkenigignens]KTB48726.1 pantothenate synthetase [Dehalogenimonas alkenigignens]PVV84858.1 pantoate--beta-alanine ligase [Dehalogenimonas alkenigignens]
MKVLRSIGAIRDYRKQLAGSVGLVPTMGFLHEGHLSLVRRSKAECEHTVVSIFVNPTQFGPDEDFGAYPRDTDLDLKLLENSGADAVFLPGAGEMYPPGTDIFVVPGKIADRLEGSARPGHFRGVATVVLKLFNLIQPQRAYFGQKDAQQTAVIRKMVADLDVPVEIKVLPTVRESDGLAMSSRNTYLNPAERSAATVLYRSLKLAQELINGGEKDAEIVRQRMTELILAEPLARVDYVSVADARSLEELTFVTSPVLVSLAVRIGRTRLIDNVMLA